jgi:hypothetical protein
MCGVIEFLIRKRDDDEWPAIPKGRAAQVLTPSGWDCAVASGGGDHRLRCADTEIWFSGEPVGWQVSIEGPMPADVATRLVATVAAQIEREVHQPIEWIRIS